jgi:hypothetical protein
VDLSTKGGPLVCDHLERNRIRILQSSGQRGGFVYACRNMVALRDGLRRALDPLQERAKIQSSEQLGKPLFIRCDAG